MLAKSLADLEDEVNMCFIVLACFSVVTVNLNGMFIIFMWHAFIFKYLLSYQYFILVLLNLLSYNVLCVS